MTTLTYSEQIETVECLLSYYGMHVAPVAALRAAAAQARGGES